MEKPQPTLPVPILNLPGKPFKIEVTLVLSGVMYDDKITPKDLVKRGLFKFYNWFDLRGYIRKPNELVMGGQILNIGLKEENN